MREHALPRRPLIRLRVVAALLGSGLALATLPWSGLALAAPESPPDAPRPDRVPAGDFLGTWVGTSKCVGDRPACKDEIVIYRFVAVEEHPDRARLLADKLLRGKRVPMGALDFEPDADTGGLRCEFTAGTTHGVWTFTIAYGALYGSLVLLPEGTVARDVLSHRRPESKMPAAPDLDAYEEEDPGRRTPTVVPVPATDPRNEEATGRARRPAPSPSDVRS